MVQMAASTSTVEEENAEWYSELEHPETFYSDAAQYWEVGEEVFLRLKNELLLLL